jgi:hypothetical protein
MQQLFLNVFPKYLLAYHKSLGYIGIDTLILKKGMVFSEIVHEILT